MSYSQGTPPPGAPVTRMLAFRGLALLAGVLAISTLGGWTRRVRAADENLPPSAGTIADVIRDKDRRLESKSGEVEVMRIQLQRANTIIHSSTRYQIAADLAAAIYDAALNEGIDPTIAFRLVKVESEFKASARSKASALGYTQIRLATARFFQPRIEEKELFDRDVNLRLGFRFLKTLMDQYHGDANLALLAYNRGPAKVQAILQQGGDPANGYPQQILRGMAPAKPATR